MAVNKVGPPDLLEAQVSRADDRVRLSHWTPPQSGTIPHIRMRKWWFNVFWAIPLGAALMLVGIAVGQELRQIPAIQQFIVRYPGTVTSTPAYYSGFPLWLRWQHFLNLLFMMFIIRAGIQILANHPRLYWKRDSTPGTEWFRFQYEVPRDGLWTAKDDSVTLPKWLGIPGVRHSIGLARWWHFSFDVLWMLNGMIFYVLLFTIYQWQRLLPTSWEIFPNALATVLQYLSLSFPPNDGWVYYNSLQQLTYFATVFFAAPLAIVTGLMQASAISNKLGGIGKIFNRQAARSIHFAVLCWFVFFVCVHVTMVFITGLRHNVTHLFAGLNDNSPLGLEIFGPAMLFVFTAWMLASPLTLRNARWFKRPVDCGWVRLRDWANGGMLIVDRQQAQHAPQSLVQAGRLMIDTERSSCAESVTLWFCGVPHILIRVVRRICASSDDGRDRRLQRPP